MERIGRVDSVWRYPVKSMRGESVAAVFAGFSGIHGDRLYAIHSTGSPADFPYLTGREQEHMLLYVPYVDESVMVETPDGEKLSIDDPRLLQRLKQGLGPRHDISLLHSDRAMTDCRPISLFNTATAAHIGSEIAAPVDPRRFRANIYMNLDALEPFGENELVGRTVRIGPEATFSILERDLRCKMVTLDPDTAEQNPAVMRCITQNHDGAAGLYATVLAEGTIHAGDEILLI
jgi:uncharacterized protein YcbX